MLPSRSVKLLFTGGNGGTTAAGRALEPSVRGHHWPGELEGRSWSNAAMTEMTQPAKRPPRGDLSHLESSSHSYAVAVTLSAIFGVLGVQHFYLKRWGEGIFDLFLTSAAIYALAQGMPLVAMAFFGLDLLHTVVVTYLLLTGQFKDGSGKIVRYPGQRA